jgi:hypothetical protein
VGKLNTEVLFSGDLIPKNREGDIALPHPTLTLNQIHLRGLKSYRFFNMLFLTKD